MPTVFDSFKAKWPVIRGREDQEVRITVFEDDGVTPFDLSEWTDFYGAAHTMDNTSPTNPPLVVFTVSYIGGDDSNQLIATLSRGQTGVLQEAAQRGRLDVFGINPTGLRKKIVEAVWVMDASVTLTHPAPPPIP